MRFYLNGWGCFVVLVIGYMLGAGAYAAAGIFAALLALSLCFGLFVERRTRESNPVGREPEPR